MKAAKYGRFRSVAHWLEQGADVNGRELQWLHCIALGSVERILENYGLAFEKWRRSTYYEPQRVETFSMQRSRSTGV